MKFSSALVAVTAVSVVSSHPIISARNASASNKSQGCAVQDKSAAAGAAYFITNEPDGNFIVGSAVGADGKLTFEQATWAGGRGSHGASNPIGPDPFFSQGAIKVAGQNVFTVNAGSNTIAMFAMDPKVPAKLRMVGQPVSTGGEFPMSVTISKQSSNVCVLNGGKVNGVNCFKQDPKLGLIQLDNTQRPLKLNQTTPPTGPAGSASHIIFNEDGSQLLASVKGVPPAAGFIASWAVDAKSGSLSADFVKSVAPQGGGLPFSMTVIPGKNAVLATDPGGGFDVFNFKAGKQAQATSTATPIKGQIATCWSSFSKKTGNFYLTDIGTSEVTEVNVDNNLKGSVVKQYPQGNASSTIDNDIATVNGKDFLYVMAPGKQSVMVLSLDAPGKTTPVQTFSFQSEVSKAGVKTSTNNLQGMTVFVPQ